MPQVAISFIASEVDIRIKPFRNHQTWNLNMLLSASYSVIETRQCGRFIFDEQAHIRSAFMKYAGWKKGERVKLILM